MKRILTKLMAVLVPCLLVVGSIGFACLADEAEAVPSETTVETEQEQPEEEKGEENKDETQEPDAQNDPDSGSPDKDSDSPDKDIPEGKDPTGTDSDGSDADVTGPADAAAPADSEGNADEDIPEEPSENGEEYQDVELIIPGKKYSFDDNNRDFKPAKGLVSAGNGLYRYELTGNDAKAYKILKNRIHEVAFGDRTSTVFEIPFSELGVTQQYFSAADLGVDTLVANGSITDEASAAMYAMVNFDIQTIVYKLLDECPFDCYWFDKTTSVSGSIYTIGGTWENGEWLLYFRSTSVSYSFPVCQAYSGGSYTVSALQVSRAVAASNKAKQIVNRYSNLSDYEKLLKYKEEICALVNYNHPAADNDDTPFGDPWQPVYVFDGDTSTDVVCEGYSKAFKYLCDLSTFDDDITCILVAGNFNTTNGANGGHMWNVVSFGNGANYLVDVTNCDDGSIGQTDKLFLKTYSAKINSSTYNYKISGVTCTYTYYQYTIDMYRDAALSLTNKMLVLAPSVTSSSSCKGIDLTWDNVSGATKYEIFRRTDSTKWQSVGTAQSNSWNDYTLEEGLKYYYGIRGVDSNNHYLNVYDDQYYLVFECNHTVVTDPAVEATYDHPGLTEGSHCSVCGKVFVEQEEIPQLVDLITITSQPDDSSGLVGKTAAFTVVAEGENLTYQWQLKKGSSWANLTSGGATTPTLSIKIDESKDGKVYRCVITNAHNEAVTDEVTLHVKQPAITITTQPVSYSGYEGSTAKFTVAASGNGLKYQWQLKKGKSWSNLTSGGAATPTLSVKVDSSKDGKIYRCLITDANGEDIATQEVSITVKQPSNAIIITTQPVNYSGYEGSTAKFTVVAEGDGLTYQWQLKKGSSWANLTSGGATTSTLSIKADSSKDGKVYRCVITDKNGEEKITDPVTISIKQPSNAITIVSQPVSYVGPTGGTARFTVVAEGEGLTYQWQLKKGSSWANLTSGGATTSSMSIKTDSSKNGKVYRCVITDANGEEIMTDEVMITIDTLSAMAA